MVISEGLVDQSLGSESVLHGKRYSHAGGSLGIVNAEITGTGQLGGQWNKGDVKILELLFKATFLIGSD